MMMIIAAKPDLHVTTDHIHREGRDSRMFQVRKIVFRIFPFFRLFLSILQCTKWGHPYSFGASGCSLSVGHTTWHHATRWSRSWAFAFMGNRFLFFRCVYRFSRDLNLVCPALSRGGRKKKKQRKRQLNLWCIFSRLHREDGSQRKDVPGTWNMHGWCKDIIETVTSTAFKILSSSLLLLLLLGVADWNVPMLLIPPASSILPTSGNLWAAAGKRRRDVGIRA